MDAMDAALTILLVLLTVAGAGSLLHYLRSRTPGWVQLLIALALIGSVVAILIVYAAATTGYSHTDDISDWDMGADTRPPGTTTASAIA